MKLVINKSVFENVVSQIIAGKDSSANYISFIFEITNSKMTIKLLIMKVVLKL